jgi:cardiolipin synthase A/B
MQPVVANSTCNWLCAGDEFFPELLGAIDAATISVRFEVYIFELSPIGARFRDALVQARRRGAEVRVLIDALGSMTLPGDFWDELKAAGGEVRRFNPMAVYRFSIRNHRKLLVCDDRVAFVGGYNVAPEYEGDGVRCGWCDLGLKIVGPLVAELAGTFDEMFARAEFRQKPFLRLRRKNRNREPDLSAVEQILSSGPGWGRNLIRHSLRRDLAKARDVRIMVAYFLPTWGLRRDLARVVRRGGRVQLILAGKSDVLVSHLAGRSLYRRLLARGVEIAEYQPQILHAKLMILDDVVYAGSANLDQRSLRINYELMIRFKQADMAREARKLFATYLGHSRQITLPEWRKSRSLWQKINQRVAYYILVRIDPYLALRQWRALPD